MESTNQETPTSVKNPWKETLEKQGIDFTIPSHILTGTDIFEKTKIVDEKTGLRIENDQLRTHTVTLLSDCIRNGKNWAVVYSDGDNLKEANNISREFGDMAIVYSAAKTIQAIEKSNLGPNVKIITSRQEDAGDEVVVWLFDVSNQDLQNLYREIDLIQAPTKINNPSFRLSTSTAVISNDDRRIQAEINNSKPWLLADNSRLAYNLYQHEIMDRAEKDVKLKKIDKDIDRLKDLPENKLLTANNMDTFIKAISETFGNSRISDKVLEILLKLVSAHSAIVMSKNPDCESAYKFLLKGVGIDDKQIESAKSTEDLLKIFQGLFGSLK
jgi:hypothetical protein